MKYRLFKIVFFSFLFAAILSIALFPKQIFLKCVAYKTASYCSAAFGGKFSYEEILWEEGKILFKNGRVQKENTVEARFDLAALKPFFNWKRRALGGELKIQGLKIVHRKKCTGPIPTPPSPRFKFLSFELETEIEGGELFLYDYLSKTHFFQHLTFDLAHHVAQNKTWGKISFALDPASPKFVADFNNHGGLGIDLALHFHSHSFADLSHLVYYFFQSYLPEPAFHWHILNGNIDGDFALSLANGAPMTLKGELGLRKIRAENPALHLFSEVDHLTCRLDVDFSQVSAIGGEFYLGGGRLSLQEQGKMWEGLWDLKNIHAHICVKEGRVERSALNGTFLGMQGEFRLDWRARETLMEVAFSGLAPNMHSLLPKKWGTPFKEAFPNDLFELAAKVKRSAGSGLELEGLLSISNAESKPYELSFGCLFCEGKQEIEVAKVIPDKMNFSLSRSVDSFLECLKNQFCLTQKRFGWFQGERLPVEKFLSPFLFQEINMKASGIADFKATFDDRYLVLFYEGENFQLDSPHFKLSVPRIKDNPYFDLSAVHYFDLSNGSHVGFLPLSEALYWQKNHDFYLEKASGVVNFENNAIAIKSITTQGCGVEFKGDVDIMIRSIDDVDLKIAVSKLQGSCAQAREFLTHFRPCFFWQLPLDGEVSAQEEALFFHYHFSPTAELIQGRMRGAVTLNGATQFLALDNYRAAIDYDCKLNQLKITGGKGVVQVGKGRSSFHFATPAITLQELPQCLIDFTCEVYDGQSPLLSLIGNTEKNASGRELVVKTGKNGVFKDVLLKLNLNQEGGNELAFSCGSWQAAGQSYWEQERLKLECSCAADKKGSLTFEGSYSPSDRTLQGELTRIECDLSNLISPDYTTLSHWCPEGELSGVGSFCLKAGKDLEAFAKFSFENLGFAGLHFGAGNDLCCHYSSSSGFSVEGLEVEIPACGGVEKYKLGLFHYDLAKEKILFEGFDFTLPPEKLPWVTQLAESLFPGKISPTLADWVEAFKRNEPLEGRISLEIEPENVWIYLHLKDGLYFLADYPLNLRNFQLVYEPRELNLWTQCQYLNQFYWLHLNTDSRSMNEGCLTLSEKEWTPHAPAAKSFLTAFWEKERGKPLMIKKMEGTFSGMDVLLCEAPSVEEGIALKGSVQFEPEKLRPILKPEWQSILDKLALSGTFALKGDFLVNREDLADVQFSGQFLGERCEVAKVAFDAVDATLNFSPDEVHFSHLKLEDKAGSLTATNLKLKQQEDAHWHFSLEQLALEELRFGRLRSPWSQKNPKEKPFFRSLFIPLMRLENFSGDLGNEKSFLGQGHIEFTNLPRRNFVSNLLFLPSEITARIGLDLTSLFPVRGTIDYKIREGKIYLTEFKEMYSDAKRSRFYLADASPAYVDFKGNLNMKVKMKQYSLLMKLAELFTISVRGTLLNPSYTLSNHGDDPSTP